MGKKKQESAPKVAPVAEVVKKEEEEAQEAPEDPPIVKELKAIDDEYLKLEREYEKEMQALQRKFEEKQLPCLQGRSKLLVDGLPGSEAPSSGATGTPAIKGFWCTALKHHPTLEEHIEDHDEAVLEYLRDITKSYVDDADTDKGFKLHFHFVENPYFTNDVLWKEYHTEEESPYTGDVSVTEIKASEIDWKPGKNVTVEKVSKKVKGGGAKKAKQKGKESEEPRESLFRSLFRNLKPGDDLPDDVDPEMFGGGESDDEDEDDAMNYLLELDHEMGCAIRDQVIAYAVRWYTGEAAPDMDDDDDEDGESEDEDGDEEESESDSAPTRGRKAAAKKGGKKAEAAGTDQAKQEECKQQ